MAIEKGKLVRWIDDKGFGFIKPEHGKDDIFIHISALKGMSRKPVIGDVIHYQVSLDANGKPRAVNAQIEGVSQALALSPLKQKRERDLPSPAKERPYRNTSTSAGKPRRRLSLFSILIVIGVAVAIYDKASKERTFSASRVATLPTEQIEQTEQFQCQGKVWCSEMTSYEEAVFYLRNCPGTKMDGDGDGIPCEQQF
jgi:cold shock CspA family protein